MKLKHLVAAFAALGFTAVASAADATSGVNAQLNMLQAKVTKMEEQMKSSGGSASSKAMGSSVTFDRDLSLDLLSFGTGAGSEMFLLNARHSGMAAHSLYLGGLLRGDLHYSNITKTNNGAVYAKTRQSATSSVDLTAAQLLFVGTINNFATGVVELKGTTEDTIVNQAYMLLGNLDESMFFGTVGKKTPTFGNFSTYNTYFAPLSRTYFQPGTVNQASIGVTKDSFTFVTTVMNGGSDQDSNLYTQGSGKLDNAAFDLKYDHEMGGVDWSFGLGFLKGYTGMNQTVTNSYGSISDNSVVAGTITTANGSPKAGAFDYNMSVAFDSFKLSLEYLVTDKKISSKSMRAFDIGAMYDFQWMGRDSDVHVDYSTFFRYGNQDDQNSATNSQFVLGLTHHCAENFQVGLEYALSRYQIGLSDSDHFSSNDVALTVQANF